MENCRVNAGRRKVGIVAEGNEGEQDRISPGALERAVESMVVVEFELMGA